MATHYEVRAASVKHPVAPHTTHRQEDIVVFAAYPPAGMQLFNKMKKALTVTPALVYYDVMKPVAMQCDASDSELGAALEWASGRLLIMCAPKQTRHK